MLKDIAHGIQIGYQLSGPVADPAMPPKVDKRFYTLSIPIIDGLYDVLNSPKQLESIFKQLKSFCFWEDAKFEKKREHTIS